MSPGTNYRLVIYCERVENPEQNESEITVKDLAEKDLIDKGIIMEEDFFEQISEFPYQ